MPLGFRAELGPTMGPPEVLIGTSFEMYRYLRALTDTVEFWRIVAAQRGIASWQLAMGHYSGALDSTTLAGAERRFMRMRRDSTYAFLPSPQQLPNFLAADVTAALTIAIERELL